MLQHLRVQAQGSDAADQTQQWMSSIWLAVVVGIAYFVAAQLSLSLLTPDGVAVFWPAAGIAAGALIALGPSARLGVVVGTMVATIVANLLGDRNLWSATVFAVCNGGEALLTAGLIERYFGSGVSLNRLRNVLGLLGAAIVGAAASGIGGSLGFTLFYGATTSILAIWQNWFLSDALGIVTTAPLVIGLASAAREPPPQSQAIEGLLALAAVAAMSLVVISLPPEPWKTVVPIALLFPLLLWIAARCRPIFASAAAFIVAVAIVWTTTFGIGHFGDPDLPIADRILAAQAGILVVALCAYVLAALFAERRQHEAALMESETRLQEALTAGAVTAFVWDVPTGSSQRSANAAQILGYEPRQMLTASNFLSRVHPDDRGRFKALIHGVRPESPTYTVTFRFKRRDGREVWLEEVAKAEFDAMGRLVRLKGLTVDVTKRKRSEEHQRLLVAELDHRVKNLLARVSVVITETSQGSGSLDEYIQALDRRIQSMADAHSLLSQNRWRGVDLMDLVHHQLAPYATDANTTIRGSNITLTVAETQGLAMVLHELVTNAAKYGALSSRNGRVEVICNHGPSEDTTNLSIVWREIGGPAIAASPQCGYGVSLIRDLIPHELGGSVDLVFASDGVCCRIEFPIKAVTVTDIKGATSAHPAASATSLDAQLQQAVPR
ncbi:MASE1 domain-containing protein [Mesorhizobium sp.]|uniref:MASE1 domain-containing protein n=1 Tax=Mesorhizobium sp. TaxID=1871066 RepID=UPI000FEA1FCD|nr:MASE1 domain-containing protein [Mesorhizobium sp.]RWP40276.1 MAG: PAS domain S-box protein [Mesorhizobium sp.]RWP67123.1 MAG: PAS domain S-box protein [Mesorhizobium sp.]